jgi:hypothetical protein
MPSGVASASLLESLDYHLRADEDVAMKVQC